MQCNHDRYFPTKRRRPQTRIGQKDVVGDIPVDNEGNLTVDHNLHFTRDKEEAKWDYFREDPFLHMFHSAVHRVIHNIKLGLNCAKLRLAGQSFFSFPECMSINLIN